jgi:hypothetical protein
MSHFQNRQGEDDATIMALLYKLFLSEEKFQCWLNVYETEKGSKMSLTASRTPRQALYYATKFSILKLVQELLNQNVKVS